MGTLSLTPFKLSSSQTHSPSHFLIYHFLRTLSLSPFLICSPGFEASRSRQPQPSPSPSRSPFSIHRPFFVVRCRFFVSRRRGYSHQSSSGSITRFAHIKSSSTTNTTTISNTIVDYQFFLDLVFDFFFAVSRKQICCTICFSIRRLFLFVEIYQYILFRIFFSFLRSVSFFKIYFQFLL